MEKDYYLGLDMGTDSVGWAVTDENYNLIRAKGKDLWGVREFESAKKVVQNFKTPQTERAGQIGYAQIYLCRRD